MRRLIRSLFPAYRIGCVGMMIIAPLIGVNLFFTGQLKRADALLLFVEAPAFLAICWALSWLFERPWRERR